MTGKTIETLIEDIYNIFECDEEVEVKEADLERFVKGVVDHMKQSGSNPEKGQKEILDCLLSDSQTERFGILSGMKALLTSRSCPGRTRLSSCMETYSNLF